MPRAQRFVLYSFAAVAIAAIAYLLLYSGACACVEPEPEPGADGVVVTNGTKSVRLQVAIADEEPERNRGLTGRTSVADTEGMLFVIPVRGPGFWMKDVPIPLDVAFIDRCGVIVYIAEMQPNTVTLHQAEKEYSYGLETAGGWYRRMGFKVGDKVRLPSVSFATTPPPCS